MYREARYDGEWAAGRPQGRGTITCTDGREYVGDFSDGLCDGYAELSSPPVGWLCVYFC